MKYKVRGGAMAAFKNNLPYTVCAERFVPGMEDGYAIKTDRGLLVRVKKSDVAAQLLKRYKIQSYCIFTVLGLIDMDLGDFVVTVPQGKFAITEDALLKFYEEDK